MTAEEPIRPASEETRYCLTDRNSAWEPCYQQRLKLEQAEVYAATIRERDEEIATLKDNIGRRYPVNSMCQDGHKRVLFQSTEDWSEDCPVCRAKREAQPR